MSSGDTYLLVLSPNTGRKRPADEFSGAKQLRSKIPRRRRNCSPPILSLLPKSAAHEEFEEESSSSCFQSELTVESTVGLAGSNITRRPRSSRLRNVKKPVSSQAPGDEFRRITRLYSKKQEKLPSAPEIGEAIATSSEKLSISMVSNVSRRYPAGDLQKKASSTETQKFPQISDSSCFESVSEANTVKISTDDVQKFRVGEDVPDPEKEDYDLDLCSDLACSEQLSDEFYDETTSEFSTAPEFEAEPFYGNSQEDYYSSEYSFSDIFDDVDFSERSDENSSPSATYSLFLQLKQMFQRSIAGAKSAAKSVDEFPQEFAVSVFEEQEDEESYRRLRSRENRDVALLDRGEDNRLDGLVLHQRLLMVGWMAEHSRKRRLQQETLFLGVSMMDRFLIKGNFNSERNLQLLGISSITLATRLEENQPYNRISQRSFTVGQNIYGRSEVVAMEWLVMEILNFQCLHPTSHNFLWFYLKAANADAEVESLSRYLAVLSLLDHGRFCFWPSTVAAGLVVLACLANNKDASCLKVMETHVQNKNDDLPECIRSLEWLVKYAC